MAVCRAQERPDALVAPAETASGAPVDDAPLPSTLSEAVADIGERIRGRRPQRHTDVQDHEFPPMLLKPLWTNLGQLLKACENVPCVTVPRDRWVSLRLDGCSWGSLLGKLKKVGILHEGFNDAIADAMIATASAVMREFGAAVGYTHSDEMTLLIPPWAITQRCEEAPASWISISASVATGEFCRRLVLLAAKKGITLDENIFATFDARLGVFQSPREAEALLLWRANDCSVNSASDAIKFYPKAPMKLRGCNTSQKLVYLQQMNLLPLKRHQAYGSLLLHDTADGTPYLCNDGADGSHMSIINLFRQGPLLPPE